MSKSKKVTKIVYFLRHGQSEDNISPVFQAPDSPLSETGRLQAKYIADRVSKISFDTLISSPYPRAKETAEIIAEATKKSPEYSELFIERIKPTSISGKPFSDSEADKIWRQWEESLYTSGLRSEDGENYDDLVARADKALEFLNLREEESIVVVTHGFFLRTIVARVILGDLLTDAAYKQFQSSASMENTGLTVLRYESGFEKAAKWKLWIYNDHAHLG